jgi:gluconate:H+ symporter, GntP family
MPPLLILLLMLIFFAFSNFKLQWPVGIALAASALMGGLLSGVPLFAESAGDSLMRHLVEGSFVYIDPILIMASALLFMKVIEENGLLESLSFLIIRSLGKHPAWLAILMASFVAFPGCLTGLTTASVLTTGAIAAAPLMAMGLSRQKTGALIAMSAILGMIAPPVNLPVMIIGGGVDMPYIGFSTPLLLLSLPLLIFCALFIAWKDLKNGDPEKALSPAAEATWNHHGLKLLLPLFLVLALLAGPRVLPELIPSLGLPLSFILGSLLALFTGKKLQVLQAARQALRQALPVMAILVGVGCFIQVMTLTGMRGELVITCLKLPESGLWASILVAMPVFGAVSAFGSASVLGVPFLLALLGRPEIWIGAGLSVMAALGDLMPPTALSGIFAAQVVGEKNYFKVLRFCLLPAAVLAAWALFLMIFSSTFA